MVDQEAAVITPAVIWKKAVAALRQTVTLVIGKIHQALMTNAKLVMRNAPNAQQVDTQIAKHVLVVTY